MIICKAAQHVYGNVESNLSPNNVGGFQTLFYTKSRLSPDEAEEIETRTIYFHGEVNPVKFLFFTLETGKAAVSRIIPQEGMDKFGRSGSYLAHSLVLETEDFRLLNANPFVVFALAHDLFLDDAAAAAQKGDMKSGNIPEIIFELEEKQLQIDIENTLNGLKKWPAAELKKLAHYAITHKEMEAQRRALVFVGSPAQITAALEPAFIFVPLEERNACSFDTHFRDCVLVRNYFWGIAYPAAGDGLSSLSAGDTVNRLPVVDAANRRLSAGLGEASSLYEEWVRHCIDTEKYGDIVFYQTAALALQALILGQPYDETVINGLIAGNGQKAPAKAAPCSSPGEFLARITAVYRPAVEAAARQKLVIMTAENLLKRVLNPLLEKLEQQPMKIYTSLVNGFDAAEVAEVLAGIFRENILLKPGRQEIKELAIFLAKWPNPYLAALLALWQGEEEVLARELDLLAAGDCRAILAGLDLKRLQKLRVIVSKNRSLFPGPLLELLEERLLVADAGTGQQELPGGLLARTWRKFFAKR